MSQEPVIRQHISSRVKDVGGMDISRALPTRERRLIGAWCFLDHAGPTLIKHDNEGMHVAPHPHTSLQTFTWMLEGEVLHRDSLGSRQIIRPNQLNLMTAGHGISHSEDTTPGQNRLHAAQLWIALPDAVRDMAPRFDHYPELPHWQENGIAFTLLNGEYKTRHAPTLQFSPLVGMDLQADSKATTRLEMRPDFEYGVFVLQGAAQVDDEQIQLNELLYLGEGLETLQLTLEAGSRVLLLGGAKLNEPVMMWWNFIGRSKEEIQSLITAWNSGDERFGRVDDDREPVPSPPIP